MQYFIDIAASGELDRLLERAWEYPSVQGIVLDLNPFWLAGWRTAQRYGEPYLKAWAPHRRWAEYEAYARPIEREDLDKWRPPGWNSDWFRTPVIVKVCTLPWPNGVGVPRAEDFQGLSEHRVVIETRPRAILAADPRRKKRPLVGGVSIGKSGVQAFGTLGVMLQDDRQNRFALTCGHVIDQNTTVDHPSARDAKVPDTIGRRVQNTHLTACVAGAKCNPWSGVVVNSEDLALIEIDSVNIQSRMEVLNVGPLHGISPRASLSTGQSVEVMGRTTRHSYLDIGGLAAWYMFSHGGRSYCFQNLFEVISPTGRRDPIRAGDSGAPVITDSAAGKSWCGMIVGCHGATGFAMYSEPIQTWWQGLGYSLSVV